MSTLACSGKGGKGTSYSGGNDGQSVATSATNPGKTITGNSGTEHDRLVSNGTGIDPCSGRNGIGTGQIRGSDCSNSIASGRKKGKFAAFKGFATNQEPGRSG